MNRILLGGKAGDECNPSSSVLLLVFNRFKSHFISTLILLIYLLIENLSFFQQKESVKVKPWSYRETFISMILARKYTTYLNCRGNCNKRSIRYHKNIKMLSINYQIFLQIVKNLSKGCLELHHVENCMAVACTELIQVTQ